MLPANLCGWRSPKPKAASHDPRPVHHIVHRHVSADHGAVSGVGDDMSHAMTPARTDVEKAAPDMLKALLIADLYFDHLKNSLEVCHHTQAMMDQVKSAIAKARGEVQ